VELNAAQSPFQSVMSSHELRTPLSIIKSYVKPLHDLRDQLRRGRNPGVYWPLPTPKPIVSPGLVNGMCSISPGLESDGFLEVWSRSSCAPAIEQTVRNYGSTPIEKSRGGFDMDVDSDSSPRVMGDWDQSLQCSTNLVGNAPQFHPSVAGSCFTAYPWPHLSVRSRPGPRWKTYPVL